MIIILMVTFLKIYIIKMMMYNLIVCTIIKTCYLCSLYNYFSLTINTYIIDLDDLLNFANIDTQGLSQQCILKSRKQGYMMYSIRGEFLMRKKAWWKRVSILGSCVRTAIQSFPYNNPVTRVSSEMTYVLFLNLYAKFRCRLSSLQLNLQIFVFGGDFSFFNLW